MSLLTLRVAVDHLEEVPLDVPFGVHVVLQPQVVLHVIDLDSSPQVTTLEPGVKYQTVILLRHCNGVLRRGLVSLSFQFR